MGKKLTKISYFKNFNIEQKVHRQLEKNEMIVQQSPRHPSTRDIFKKIEETTPNVDEMMINKDLVEKSKNVKVYTGEKVEIKDNKDKRPKKENEILTANLFKNIDFEKYGYVKPEKIRPGSFTLRQFDETIHKYAISKSIEEFNELIAKNDLEKESIPILIEYYKPFRRLNQISTNNSNNEKTYLTNIAEPTKLESNQS